MCNRLLRLVVLKKLFQVALDGDNFVNYSARVSNVQVSEDNQLRYEMTSLGDSLFKGLMFNIPLSRYFNLYILRELALLLAQDLLQTEDDVELLLSYLTCAVITHEDGLEAHAVQQNPVGLLGGGIMGIRVTEREREDELQDGHPQRPHVEQPAPTLGVSLHKR